MPGPASPPSADSADRLSTTAPLDELGAYEVISQLDCGPVTTSYLSRKSGKGGNDGPYVLSVVHDDLRTHRWLIDQLLSEAAKCAAIRHPNVEAIVDFGTVRDRSFIVTRYIEGCSLARLLSLSAEMPYRIALPLIVDVLRGLHAAHTQRDAAGNRDPILHSGVSPASILVGRDGIARIAEFGIARVQMRTTQTMPGVRHDRFAHLAPEQIGDVIELEPSADIFAVGTVLWSVLTGLPLFRGSDPVDTMHRVLHVTVPLPSSVGRHPPVWLDEICMLALEKNPHQRHASAEHMASALQAKAVQNKCWAPRPEIAAWVQAALEPRAAPQSAIPSVSRGEPSQEIRSSVAVGSIVPREDSTLGASRRSRGLAIVLAALGSAIALTVVLVLALRSSFTPPAEPPAQRLPNPAVATSLIPPSGSVEPIREPKAEIEAVAEPRPADPVPHPAASVVQPGATNLRPPDPRRASPTPFAGSITRAPRAAPVAAGPAPNPPTAAPPAVSQTTPSPSLPNVERNPYMRH